jgi:outer membrane protein assembly factor BamB
LLFFAAWSDGKADAPLPPLEKFLEQFDKNKDGAASLDEFDEASREFYRGYDVNRDGKIDKTDWDQLTAAVAKGENVLVAVKPGGKGNISQTHVAWKTTKGLPYVASPLFYDGRIYMVKNGGLISSLDAETGKPFYSQERLEAGGNYYSSPVAGGGRIYLASVAGKLTVLKAGGDKPEILHRADFGERIFASPALAGSNLYLRTQASLYAFQD